VPTASKPPTPGKTPFRCSDTRSTGAADVTKAGGIKQIERQEARSLIFSRDTAL
jgi:hypothetical protein